MVGGPEALQGRRPGVGSCVRAGVIACLALALLFGCAQSSTGATLDAGTANLPPSYSVSGHVSILDNPSVEEGRTRASFRIHELGRLGTAPMLTGARVIVGGVEAVEEPFQFVYQTPRDAVIDGAEPAGRVTLFVEHPAFGSTTLDMECPTDFTVTEPAPRTVVSAGSSVAVRWTGRVFYEEHISESAAEIFPWDEAKNQVTLIFGGALMNYATIYADTEGVSVVPPSTEESGYAVDVSASGSEATNGMASVQCILTHRVHLLRE